MRINGIHIDGIIIYNSCDIPATVSSDMASWTILMLFDDFPSYIPLFIKDFPLPRLITITGGYSGYSEKRPG